MKKPHPFLEAREDFLHLEPTIQMFSPASFFDVLHPTVARIVSAPVGAKQGKIVAFYGFKGGAGRSTALGYVAVLLAQRGLHVIALDLDLEAPGLAPLFGHGFDAAPQGTLHLLHEASRLPEEEELGVARYLLPVPETIGPDGGKVEYLPAGTLDDRYLAQLEELGIGLWHTYEPTRRNPLARILNELQETRRPDVILLDCRTGFSSLSATALFHAADAIVTVLPLSEQIWGGLDVLLRALEKTRQVRTDVPSLLLVPSLILPGKEGDARLAEMNSRLQDAVHSRFPFVDDDETIPVVSAVEILEDGIRRRDSVWAEGRISIARTGDSDLFRKLANWVGDALLEEEEIPPDMQIDRRKTLGELQLDKSVAFSENLSVETLSETLIDSKDARAAVDRSISLVIGAKGAGKTFLWRYLALPDRPRGLEGVPPDVDYVVAMSPDQSLTPDLPFLSAAAFQKIEKDSRLESNGNHQAFWIWWSLQAISRRRPDIVEGLLKSRRLSTVRAALQRFLEAPDSGTLLTLLRRPDTMLEAEIAFAEADELLRSNLNSVCILVDGLDTGFQTAKTTEWLGRRNRFTTGILQLLGVWRTRLKRIQFKVFLREDIWIDVEMQNKSHLGSISHVLQFEETEMWELVLRVASRSPTYEQLIQRMRIDVLTKDPIELRKALAPLWGMHLEKGNSAYSTNYIVKRLADAKGRLFPRSVLQMVQAAIESQRKDSPVGQADRVLRFASLRDGIDKASNGRVTDLKSEYVEMSGYLDAMADCLPVLSRKDFVEHLKKALKAKDRTAKITDIESVVIPKLIEIGVLRVKTSAKKAPEVEVARLYRDGLHMKPIKGLQ